MLRRVVLAIAAAAQFSAASLAHGQTATAIPAVAAAPSQTHPVSSTYRIGADDTLEIVVFQVPELSRVVQVDANGQFILPFVGTVDAVGHTADELTSIITRRLSAGYLRDPQVTVLVKEAVSQRVTIDGGVTKPGTYSLSGPTSLMQAISLANGPDPRIANIKKVAVIRTINGQRSSQIYDLTKVRDGREADPAIQAGDIIIVDISGARSFFSYYGSALSFLTLFRPF